MCWHQVLYVGHNVTGMVKPGANEIVAQIGNSKWGYLDIYTNRTLAGDQSGDSTRAFRMMLLITLLNGTELSVVTAASSWQARHGPIVYDHLWHGEIYDARQAAAAWMPAKTMRPNVGRMYPQLMPPIRVTQSYAPVSINASINGAILVDFGQNMAGVPTLELPAAGVDGGDVKVVMLRLKHTEILDAKEDAFNNFFPGMEFNHASATCSMEDWYQRKW